VALLRQHKRNFVGRSADGALLPWRPSEHASVRRGTAAAASPWRQQRRLCRRPLAFAIPRPHIANDGLGALMDMHMLDPHVLRCAMLEAPQKLHLNRESPQQAARRRSRRRDSPIPATPTA